MCACGGGSGGGASSDTSNSPGVLLSGTLDGQYAGLPGGTAGPSVAEADVSGKKIFSEVGELAGSGAFWVVLFFVVGAAYVLDRRKSE